MGPGLAWAAGVAARLSSGAMARHIPSVPDLPAHDALADTRMVRAALRHVLGHVLGHGLGRGVSASA